MTDLGTLNEMELDVLKELGNIGAGHAATSLSKLLGKEVTYDRSRGQDPRNKELIQ